MKFKMGKVSVEDFDFDDDGIEENGNEFSVAVTKSGNLAEGVEAIEFFVDALDENGAILGDSWSELLFPDEAKAFKKTTVCLGPFKAGLAKSMRLRHRQFVSETKGKLSSAKLEQSVSLVEGQDVVVDAGLKGLELSVVYNFPPPFHQKGDWVPRMTGTIDADPASMFFIRISSGKDFGAAIIGSGASGEAIPVNTRVLNGDTFKKPVKLEVFPVIASDWVETLVPV